MANLKPEQKPPAADQPAANDAPPATDTDVLAARIAELEAENAVLRDAVDTPPPAREARLAWIVTYPRISVQPKGEDGEPLKVKDGDTERVADPIILEKGAVLPPECEWQAEQLKSFGHVTALSVPAQ